MLYITIAPRPMARPPRMALARRPPRVLLRLPAAARFLTGPPAFALPAAVRDALGCALAPFEAGRGEAGVLPGGMGRRPKGSARPIARANSYGIVANIRLRPRRRAGEASMAARKYGP